MKSIFYLATIALIATILSSCCACRQGSPKIGQLEDNKWKLIEFETKAVPSEKAIVLKFDSEKKMIYGDAPCNNFFASYATLKNKTQNIEIKNAGSTKMYCPDSEIEDALTRQISEIVNVKIEGDNILLINKEGNLVAIFTKV